MKWKLFHREDRYGELARLFREAEQSGREPELSSPAYEDFLAHQELIRRLGSMANQPATSAAGRAALLAAVARQTAAQEDRKPMIGRLLTARGLAALAAAAIFAGGAITVGASGGVGGAAGNAGDVLSALHITQQGDDDAHSDANATEESDTTTPEAEHTSRAVVGIPTDNPEHQPEASGTCEKGDTVVKTVPSGVAVNVPCQAAEDHGKGDHEADETEAPEANETPEATTTPQPEATEHGEHGDNRSDRTPAPHPDEPAAHATEHAEDSSGR